MTKINLSVKQPFSSSGSSVEKASTDMITEQISDVPIGSNLQFLMQSAPNKVLYSIKETAKVLGLSYEFVRAKICSGKVRAKPFGTRKLVHVNELSRLLTEGLPV